MHFDYIDLIMNPFVLMFIAVTTGLGFGKIKFGRFSFESSGTLFTGLIIGWLVYQFGSRVINQGNNVTGYNAAQEMFNNGIIHSYFFDISLIFFVAAVGLLAAKNIEVVVRKYGKTFIVLGILIPLIGAGATYGATALIKDTNTYEVAGLYTGALTSSPGLGSALETAEDEAIKRVNEYSSIDVNEKEKILDIIDDSTLTVENTKTLSAQQEKTYVNNAVAGVGIGHAIGYPFGVIIVIFAMNFFPSVFKMDLDEERRRYQKDMVHARRIIKVKEIPTTSFNIISFTITCAIGYLVGNIEIYLGSLGYFCLGSTGGVLITGLFLGYIGKIGSLSFRMDPKTLSIIRELSLSFFLAIVGLKYGFKTFDALFGSGLVLALTSLFIGIIAMLIGFIIGRYVFRLNWIILSGVICGGMTSTPGLGAAIDALDSDEPASGYGATYPFALLGMIIFTIVLHKLPLL